MKISSIAAAVAIAALLLLGAGARPVLADAPAADPVVWAHPLVGTAVYGGALTPGACLPYSVVKLGPDTTKPSTAGYNPIEPIIGFSHTHISGTGGKAFAGQISVRPQTGPLDVAPPPSPKQDEFAAPGYYAVTLTQGNVKAELTATERSGVHRYTFPPGAPARLLIDVSATINNASPQNPSSVCAGSEAHFVGEREIEGQASFAGGYGNLKYTVYFAATFDQRPTHRGAWSGRVAQPDALQIVGGKGDRAGLYAEFAPRSGMPVGLRVGISYSSVENARRFRAASDGMTFDQVKARAQGIWRAHLRTVEIEGGTAVQRRQFYTALYHSALAPVDLTGDNDAWSSTEPSY